MEPKINPEFLPAQAPAKARCHRIDFTSTNPPIPAYKDYLAAVIDDILTEAECKELLRLAESTTYDAHKQPNAATTPTWERALINVGNGKQALSTHDRNCGRIIADMPTLAEKLHARLLPFLQELGIDRIENQPAMTGLVGRGKTYQMTRLNERLRFLKYVGGEYFRPHWDGKYTTPDKRECSYFTVHLYLNGEGEQDRRELKREMKLAEKRAGGKGGGEANLYPEGRLLGGATSFLPRFEEKDKNVRVFPKTGSVLIFQQYGLLHSGDAVFRGTKYTMRTDIMYEQVGAE